MKEILKQALKNSVSYESYFENHEQLVAEEKTTGGHTEEMYIKYTKLNLSRSKRVAKKIEVLQDVKNKLSALNKKETWLVITEPWCGDAAQTVPVFHALSQENKNIEFRLVYRDENPELMSHFLTDGGTAIPIVVFVDADAQEVKGHWGPRPEKAQQMIRDFKALEVKPSQESMIEDMQKWYNSNKTVDTQTEFISKWSATQKQ